MIKIRDSWITIRERVGHRIGVFEKLPPKFEESPLPRVYACASTRYQYPRESPLYFPPLHHCRQRFTALPPPTTVLVVYRASRKQRSMRSFLSRRTRLVFPVPPSLLLENMPRFMASSTSTIHFPGRISSPSSRFRYGREQRDSTLYSRDSGQRFRSYEFQNVNNSLRTSKQYTNVRNT